jgi:hypothetical protein
MSNPAPGTARINDGPWLPCRFTLNGTSQYVDWSVDAILDEDLPHLGPAQIEIAICEGVTVFGDAIVTDLDARSYGASATAHGNGALRGTR